MAAATTTVEDLHPDIIARVLRCMDGPTLVATSCTTTILHFLTSDPALWRRLCLSMWPSLGHPRLLDLLSGSHSSFFSDAFPFPDDMPAIKHSYPVPEKKSTVRIPPATADDLAGPTTSSSKSTHLNPRELTGSIPLSVTARDDQTSSACLISAVDLYHKGIPVFSRVIETDTSSAWFLASPFRIDGLDRKDPEPYPPIEQAINPEDLTLSWTFIDPATRRAVNVSSRSSVAIKRHWYTGETLVRFVVILQEDCAVSTVVTCAEDTGHVMEVCLKVESLDGISVTGRGTLEILKGAMEGKRRGLKAQEELKMEYEEFLRKKKEIIERKARREGILDLCCTGFGALMFLSFLIMLAFR